MEGIILLPESAEPLELRGPVFPARTQPAPRPPPALPARATVLAERQAAHEAWLQTQPRTRICRPLSPICPMVIGAPPPAPTFWRRPEFQRIIPIAGSIIVHAVIVIVGFMTFRDERPRIRGGIPFAGSITTAQAIASTDISATFIPVPTDFSGETPQAERIFAMPHDPRVSAQQHELATVAMNVVLPPSDDASSVMMLGVGPQAVPSLPSMSEVAIGANNGTASNEMPREVAGGSTETKFFGVQGTGQAVIYVCDASGSMLGTNELVTGQLQRAVLALHKSQVFNVIFFSGRGLPVLFDAREVVPANAGNKLAACTFAKRYNCGGNTNGLPAIRAALERNPDVMYLVTDGDFDDSDAILSTIRSMNGDGFTKINIILVSGAAKHDPAGHKFLKRIAEENGGTCRIVDPNSF